MKKRQTTINIILCLLILFLAHSCQENTYYHTYQPVDSTGWNKHDTLFYPLPASIDHESYQVEIGVRHKDSYPYRDLWLTVNHDTLHLYLADSTGYWTGKGIGNLRLFTQDINLSNAFKDSIQDICITHIMSENPLVGISDIGIQIKHKP